MNCNVRTMLKIAAGLGVTLTVAYVALPEAQAFILASAPILVALICPLAMVGMMLTMKGTQAGNKSESVKPSERRTRAEAQDATPDKA